MTDHIDELERLNALRQRGSLSETEYAQAKANLLGKQRSIDTLPRWVKGATWVIGLALAIFVIKPLIKSSSAGVHAAASPDQGGWEINKTTDPMTDKTVATATTTIAGTAADIQVALTCDGTGMIAYSLSSFDKSGKPVEMRTDINDQLDRVVSFGLRLDNGAATSQRMVNPDYNNRVLLSTPEEDPAIIALGMGSVQTVADEASRASRLVFALHLAHSDETVILDQSAPAVRSMLAPCIAVRDHRFSQAREFQRKEEQNSHQPVPRPTDQPLGAM